jgi:serine/threonine protein phosphatase PrpC
MKSANDPSGLVSLATAQGDRSHQEDRAICEWLESPVGRGWLLAIFDGHRGAATADMASQALSALFKDRFKAARGDAERALHEVFLSLHEMTSDHLSGSTATVVFIPSDAECIYLAVLGDSPVAILDSGGHPHFGPDHNIRTNWQERSAALARGGVYQAGYLEDPQCPGVGLQMTRSLGDADLSRVLLREPEKQKIPLGGKGIVIIGSDGLLLPGGSPSAEQLGRLVRLVQEGADAQNLVADAEARGTGDNVTAIVWRKDQ